MSIELLFVRESLEVRFDSKRNNTGRVVGKILLESLGIYRSSHVGNVVVVVSRRMKLFWRGSVGLQVAHLRVRG